MNIDQYEKLPITFYTRADVVKIAKELIGKYLFTEFDGVLTAGRIVETEAYNGRMDKACHAFHKRTPRTEIMYEEGGRAYVYLCYGMHHLFNVVTHKRGFADAVLIRGLEPVLGGDEMMKRRKKETLRKISAGPGTLSEALGIKHHMTGTQLNGDKIWIATSSEKESFEIETDVRIGVDYAEEDALLPWRFYEKGNSFVSKQKKKPRF